MQHPPSYLLKLAAGGGSWVGGGGLREGGIGSLAGGGGAARDPLLPHAYLKGGGGVWGHGDNSDFSSLQEESLKGLKDQKHSTPFN